MNIFKDNSKILIIFLLFYLILLNLFQLSEQHWSSILDQDIIIIYNSLLVSSGIEQEFRDHPAYTTFTFLGVIFKFLSFFFENFTIQEVLNSDNIDKNLQNFFIIGRILNSVYLLLLTLVLLNILKNLNIKKNLSVLLIFLIVILQDTYELLFLIRSEVLSILMILFFLNFLIKFIKKKKINHLIISGFFLCLAMLAKIQVIFLFFTFLISLPFLINYINSSKQNIFYNKNYYILNIAFLFLFLASYILTQSIFDITFLSELNDERYYFAQNLDTTLLILFVIFYSFYINILTKKNLTKPYEIVIIISSILTGFILCVLFIIFLDIINLIPFNKSILTRLTNPLEHMLVFTSAYKPNVGISDGISSIISGFGGFLDVNFDKNTDISTILYLDPRNFFRTLQVFLFIFLIYFSIKKIKYKNIHYLSISLFIGIIIQYLGFNLRETHGYNMYLFPLYLIIASIIFSELKKKAIVVSYLVLFVVFISENIVLSDIHKNAFSREPRVYEICKYEKIETSKWRNSENYLNNYNNTAFIKLVRDPKSWFYKYTKKFAPSINQNGKIKGLESEDIFFKKYCNQIKNEKNFRSHSYKLKL
jgi:hypothetical protein